MRRLLKTALLIASVTGLVWGAAIWYWRDTNSQPDGKDLLVFLVLLPLGILLLLWLGRYAVGLLTAAPALSLSSAELPAAAAPAPAAPALPPLVLVASALRVPHGNSARELAGALADNKGRAGLDPELVDDQGYPIMSARVEGADDPAVQVEMLAWLALQSFSTLHYNDEQWRALTLASAVATELGQRLAVHEDMQAPTAPTLQLLILWQAGWQLHERAAAAQWMRHLVARQGWPLEKIVMEPELAGDPSSATPAALLTRLARQRGAGHPVLALALACGSHIGEASVVRWSANNALFSAAHGQGKVPGEGAAGLLLADPAQATLLDNPSHVMLHSVEGQRQDSIAESKRTDASVLRKLAELVLVDSATDADAVAMIVADTGNRTNRVMETMGLAGAVAPQLDTGDELLQIGAASGTCSAVPFLTVLALAAHQSAELDAPILCLSNEDPLRRSAALLWPAPSLA